MMNLPKSWQRWWRNDGIAFIMGAMVCALVVMMLYTLAASETTTLHVHPDSALEEYRLNKDTLIKDYRSGAITDQEVLYALLYIVTAEEGVYLKLNQTHPSYDEFLVRKSTHKRIKDEQALIKRSLSK